MPSSLRIDPSAADPDLLARAQSLKIGYWLPFDTDYGSLTYRDQLPATCGIVTFRLIPDMPADCAGEVGHHWNNHGSG